MSAHSPEEIRAHLKTYYLVFGALAVLTVITVGASYLHLSFGPGVTLALAIATLKATLVALFFMHLKGEVKVIYWVLLLTFVFFVGLMMIPIGAFIDRLT